ncbi:MAG TPA: Bax inhibitor-1 family protein [Thiolinea sp.]|nr:Bax inhibitor-1 family protein [Thiolinea sp.]
MNHLDINSGALVADANEVERAGFIRRTYYHLAGAILAYILLETLLVKSGVAESFLVMLQGSKWYWLGVMAAFMAVSYLADRWAGSSMSRELQYAGLGLYIVAMAVITMPVIYVSLNFAPNPDVLPAAALVTLMLAAGITVTAFTTKKDFSFLRPFIMVGSFVLLGVIVAAIIFGFSLGLLFLGFGIVLFGATMLYQTSALIHHYHTEQHVAASLGLFSSVGMMFIYVLQFLMSLAGE